MRRRPTHRQGRVLVQLVLGGDAEAGVVAAGGPGQGDGGLQLVVHLLVDGAAELGAVVAGRGGTPVLRDSHARKKKTSLGPEIHGLIVQH